MSYIYKKLSVTEMVNDLISDEFANWNRPQAEALVQYLEELANDSDEPMEWDVVAIRCEWSYYPHAVEALLDHCEDVPDDMTHHEALEILFDNTAVIECEGFGVIILNY